MPLDVKANVRILRRNKYTVFSLIIILAALYVLKSRMPVKDAQYFDVITYNNAKYKYADTIKASPIKFVRAGSTKEGSLVLIMRKDKKSDLPEVIYIYAGSGRYLMYRLMI